MTKTQGEPFGGGQGELPIPPAAGNDPGAQEVLRAWVADESLHCSIRTEAWKDPAAWGIFLADAARQVTGVLEGGHDGPRAALRREEILRRIADQFASEIRSPSGDPAGSSED